MYIKSLLQQSEKSERFIKGENKGRSMAKTLGDYLRNAGYFAGLIGAGIAGTLLGTALEPFVSKAKSTEIKPSGIEQRLKEAPKPPNGIMYAGGIVYAQEKGVNSSPPSVERVSAEEYYRRATKAEFIAPGARTGPYGLPLTEVTYAIIGNKWDKLYDEGKNGSNRLYDALSRLNGRVIEVDGTKFVFNSGKQTLGGRG